MSVSWAAIRKKAVTLCGGGTAQDRIGLDSDGHSGVSGFRNARLECVDECLRRQSGKQPQALNTTG